MMVWLRMLRSVVAGVAVSVGLLSQAMSQTILEGEYKLPATVDATVTTSLATELWARVYRPQGTGPFPLVVFLHGNHATCGRFDAGLGIRIDDRTDYTFSGTCPGGYVVAPSHAGYHYLARPLAKKGYIVVSINANRGVNAAPGVSGDGGLNLRRGRLVLRHLQELASWNAGTTSPPASLGFPLAGTMDFSHVGLMGHSRGGEGMRAAIDQYREAGSPWPARIGSVTFEGLYEIGPVDGQTSRILNAVGLPWNVLLPGCDGDVSNLQGVRPFDRMMLITNETKAIRKSTFEVYGANHNFYNTEWQQSDAGSCLGQTPLFPSIGGSSQQRTTALQTLVPFMEAFVGPAKLPGRANRFDPSYPLPSTLTSVAAYARGFSPAPRANQNFVIDNFDRATGTSTRNVANQSSGLTQYFHGSAGSSHDATQRAAIVSWGTSGSTRFLQTNASAAGAPLDVSINKALEFRVALQCSGSLCSSTPSPTGDVDFSIALADSDGNLSIPVTLKSFAVVRRPVGSFSTNVVFQTVRIPLDAFTGFDLTRFRGVRFTFDQTSSRVIQLGNVRLTRKAAGPGGLPPAPPPPPPQLEPVAEATAPAAAIGDVNSIVAVRPLAVSTQAGTSGPVVEIELQSSRPFPVGGALPEITIGARSYALSRFAEGDTDRLIFTLGADEYAAAVSGEEVSVRVGGAPVWRFGRLTK
jgi:hypothetical protein